MTSGLILITESGYNGYKIGETICGIYRLTFHFLKLELGDRLNPNYHWFTKTEMDNLDSAIKKFRTHDNPKTT